MTTLLDKQRSAISYAESRDVIAEGLAMTRIAHCCCGSLRVETTGEPAAAAKRTPCGVARFFRCDGATVRSAEAGSMRARNAVTLLDQENGPDFR
jgi:hypothetical protein